MINPSNDKLDRVRRRPVLYSRLTPIVAAFAISAVASTSVHAQANSAPIQAKLGVHLTDVGSTKAADRVKAKSADLILALVDTIDDGGFLPGDLAAGALQGRKDIDSIVASVVEQAILAAGAEDSALDAKEILTKVFTVLTTDRGRAAALASALRVTNAPNAGAEFASVVALGDIVDKQKFVTSTLIQVGSSAGQVKSFVNELFTDGVLGGSGFGTRDEISIAIANGIASKTINAAGQVLGSAAIIKADDQVDEYLTVVLRDAKKSAKAYGEAIAATLAEINDKAIIPTVIETLANSDAVRANDTVRAQLAQGVARQANIGDIHESVHFLLDENAKVSRSKFAATAVVGLTDPARVGALTESILTNAGTTKPLDIAKALVKGAPAESASGVVEAYLTSTGTARSQFAAEIATATTNALAIGGVIKQIATGQALINQVDIAANAINKASKSATAIAMSVSQLVADIPAFAVNLKLAAPKAVEQIVVGASISEDAIVVDPATGSEAETVIGAVLNSAITNSDKSTIAKAVKIATSVAAAVGIEQAADVARTVAGLISLKGEVAGKPLKASAAGQLASGIAKAINKKSFVSTVNRADEIGEVGAAIVGEVLKVITTSKDAVTMVTQVATSVIKALSTKELVSTTNRNLADIGKVGAGISSATPQSNVANVAGSILAAVRLANPSLVQAAYDSLIKALPKLGGKNYSGEVTAALNEVLAGTFNVSAYETGSVYDPETDTRNK